MSRSTHRDPTPTWVGAEFRAARLRRGRRLRTFTTRHEGHEVVERRRELVERALVRIRAERDPARRGAP